MPAIRPNLDGGGGEKRTTFRPPWVKDGPCPLPCPPTNPWLQQAKQEKKEAAKNVPTPTPLKKPKEKEIKVNVEPDKNKELNKPKEKEVKINVEPEKNKEVNKPKEKEIKINIEREKPKEVNTPKAQHKEKEVERIRDVPPKKPEPSRVKEPVVKKVEFNPKTEERIMEPIPPQAPMPPPPPPMAPPPPPPQAKLPSKPVSKEKALKLEALRSRPRRRPDWTDMMKEVEQGIKLKHVQCNDRSAPVLPSTKTKGQFVYESETQNSHNVLLKEIQKGVHLRKVKTNDRSKPNLEGLRKFRRQMTIEEIITKSASVADVVAVASQPDELDDIDKVRDDLQSTKQMLALELRNKEALERENKRLLARLANLEAELEKEKLARSIQEQGAATKLTRTAEDDKLISRLKDEAAQSAAMTKEMEEKYHQTAEELDLTRAKLESAWLKNAQLEMELKSKGKYNPPLTKQASTKKIPNSASEKKIHGSAPVNKEAEDSDTVTESESEEEEEEEELNETTSAATQEERELKLLNNKLKTLKDKKAMASNEKKNLKSQLSKLQHVLKEEKKKYKLLQKEVEKMASLMKDVDGDEEEEEEEEDDAEEEDEEETESESESEEEVVEEEVSEDASHHEKVKNLNSRIRTFENLLTRAKKGNYLLKANIERKQDDVNRQKEMSLALQEDLNAVLSELG